MTASMILGSTVGRTEASRNVGTTRQTRISNSVPTNIKSKLSDYKIHSARINTELDLKRTDRSHPLRRGFLSGFAGALIGTLGLHNNGHNLVFAEEGPQVTARAFFDISVDGTDIGRIVVGVYGEEAPVGAQRFLELAQNKQGVGYRRTTFDKLSEDFVQNAGVRSLTYGAGEIEIIGGEYAEELEVEMRRSRLKPTSPGQVALIVRNEEGKYPEEGGSKMEFVNGKLVEVVDAPAPRPNGTALTFTSSAFPSPDYQHPFLLEETTLIIGRVLEGQDVVDLISSQPRVKPNQDSPFFKTAKAIGDTRAKVAEQGFGRPFSKILVKKSGILID